MPIKNWKREIFTIPNLLSLFRLLLIPLYISIYLNAESERDYFLAAAILAVSCLTDMIDGQIARRCNMISTVGKVLDPRADKATQLSLSLCLAVRHSVLWLLVVLFSVKEIFQLVAGLIRLKKGMILKGALYSGKISTTILFISLIVMVLLPSLSETAIHWIAAVDAVALTAAFIDYAMAYCKNDTKFQPISESIRK